MHLTASRGAESTEFNMLWRCAMRMHHTPSHWILLLLVLVALLFTLSEAHGQGSGAAAVFQGRPALAGAQGGLGAQAGPPQGGIGVQGPQAAERTMHLRPPGQNDTTPAAVAAADDVAVARAADHKIVPRDTGVARDQRSVTRKVRRATKRTLRHARTGTPPIDSTASTPK
jgi:hypothetical protein